MLLLDFLEQKRYFPLFCQLVSVPKMDLSYHNKLLLYDGGQKERLFRLKIPTLRASAMHVQGQARKKH